MLEILVGTVAAFVLGGAYYAVFATEGGEMRPWMLAVEVLRCLVLVAVVAGLASEAGVDSVAGGLALGAALFVGFPLVLWVGRGRPRAHAGPHGRPPRRGLAREAARDRGDRERRALAGRPSVAGEAGSPASPRT